jgi:hypothetical protein
MTGRFLGLLLALLSFAGSVAAEPVTTIRSSGPSANRIDLVVLGDGYSAADLASGKYATDVQVFMDGVFAQEPYREYRSYFNVHRVDVTSAESGADHPPSVLRNTALDASYSCAGIQRFICVSVSKVTAILSASIPDPAARDVILVLVNDPEYGGSGGSLAVASTHSAAVELVLHEQGHSFGLLADEYGGPPPPACNTTNEPTAANATTRTQLSMIKWNSWIDSGTVLPTPGTVNGVPGLYVGAAYCDAGMYRPTYNSKMRSLGLPFHQINTEQHVKRMYNYVSPIDTATPAAAAVQIALGSERTFSVQTPQPATHALTIAWFLDGQSVATGVNQVVLSGAQLSPGSHTLQVIVFDETPMVRNDPAQVLRDSVSWTVVRSTGLDINIDGHADLFWHHQGDGRISGWLMNGTTLAAGTLTTPSQVADTNWKIVGTGDLDGDGQFDLVWQNIADGRVSAWLMNGLTQREGTLFSIPQVADTNWRIRSVGDLNGDGRADLFWQHQGDGRVSVWLMNGTQVVDGTLLSPSQVPDTNWKIVGTADFDGNGSRDLVWHHQGDGRIAVWFMNGTSLLAGTATNPGQVADTTWKIRAVGDMNADGRPDLIWQNSADGRISVWLMNGLNVLSGLLLTPSQVADTNWHIVGPR